MSIRILVDSGNYFSNNDNLGDRAIYQVIIGRLRQIWLGCEIRWITRNANLPGLIATDLSPLVLTEERRPLQEATRDGANILAALNWCDLVLATGGGYFSDSFAGQAWSVLDTLEAGVRIGKPAAILSCGFEPIGVQALSTKMLSVLPQLRLIACREQILSPSVVRSFGVAQQCVTVVGDEAIELAYDARQPKLGQCLGLNLRQADYAGIDAGAIGRLRELLRPIIVGLGAPVVPVPISMFGPSDSVAIAALLNGIISIADTPHTFAPPEGVMRQVGDCRIVVSGSYHAAVFALSQGVSVVALVASPHYRAKMEGLRAQFGVGCRVVSLDRDDTNVVLTQAIDEGWRDAQLVRLELLRAAQRQIAAGRAVYEQLRSLLTRPGQDRELQALMNGPIEIYPRDVSMPQTTNQHSAEFSLSPHEIDTFRSKRLCMKLC